MFKRLIALAKFTNGVLYMAVIAAGINDRSTMNNNLTSKDFLQVNCCGIFENISEESRTYRPTGRKDYQIILIVDGFLSINCCEKTIKVENNQFLLIPPNCPNDYSYSNPVNAVWMHFSGTSVDKILDLYGIDAFTAYTITDISFFRYYTDKIIEEMRFKKIGYMNICNAYMLQILTQLKRKIEKNISHEMCSKNTDIGITIDKMKTEFAVNNDIEYYAQMCNMSVSRYSHIFTQKMNISPHRYIIELRIAQAKFLLSTTNVKIYNIAKSIGYDDPFYFSKSFKKMTGLSPSDFREKSKKENR